MGFFLIFPKFSQMGKFREKYNIFPKGLGLRKADHVFQHRLVYNTKGNEKNEILIKPDKIEVFCAFFHESFFSVVFTVKGQCRGKYKVRDNFPKFHVEVSWAMK